jgi:hypothetical protein
MLDLVVNVINIGYNNRNPVLDASPTLMGYSRLVFEIGANIDSGMARDKAIKTAVDRCVEQGILADFLRKNYEEVLEMLTFEFNAEVAERVRREEAEEKGMTRINLLNKYLRANNLMDEFDKSLDDPAYQNELIARYNFTVETELLTDTVNA